MTLIRSGDGDQLVFEYGDGPIEAPLVANELKIDREKLRAKFRGREGEISLKARLKDEGAITSIDFPMQAPADGADEVPRVRRLSKPTTACGSR